MLRRLVFLSAAILLCLALSIQVRKGVAATVEPDTVLMFAKNGRVARINRLPQNNQASVQLVGIPPVLQVVASLSAKSTVSTAVVPERNVALSSDKQHLVMAEGAREVVDTGFPPAASNNTGDNTGSDTTEQLQSPEPENSEPLRVALGIYVLDVAKLDLKESGFYLDFYIWFKTQPNSTLEWEPSSIEFMNGTIESASPLASETTLEGESYWIQRIKGTFRGNFNLHAYPFDVQDLPIIIEDSEYPAEEVVFVPDPAASRDFRDWAEPRLQIPDWSRQEISVRTYVHQYATEFGLGKKSESDYSRFVFTMRLNRLFIPHLIKFIIPLLVIAGMAYMVFFINANEFESQCGICVTSLLSAVALHIAQTDVLPAVGYLVISDKIFILFYIVIFSALVQTVLANNYAKRGNTNAAARLDDAFRWGYPLLLVLGSIGIALTNMLGL